jgi:hypothetical protein
MIADWKIFLWAAMHSPNFSECQIRFGGLQVKRLSRWHEHGPALLITWQKPKFSIFITDQVVWEFCEKNGYQAIDYLDIPF